MERPAPRTVGFVLMLAGALPALILGHPSHARGAVTVQEAAPQDVPAPEDTVAPLTAEIDTAETETDAAATGTDQTDATPSESPELPPYETLELDTIPTSVSTGMNLSTVTGTVTDRESREPVASAVVVMHPIGGEDARGLTTRTDDHGRFRFKGIPSGDYQIQTHHIGYEDRTDTLSVGVKVLVQVDVQVGTEAVGLPPVKVTVRQGWLADTGFYYRKEAGFGKFLTPEDLDKRNAPRMTQVLRQIPGIRVSKLCGAFSCTQVVRMSATNAYRACSVTYYMDGREMHGPVSIDHISPLDVAAVEIYQSIAETPAQFYGRCGSIVIWSKRAEFGSSND